MQKYHYTKQWYTLTLNVRFSFGHPTTQKNRKVSKMDEKVISHGRTNIQRNLEKTDTERDKRVPDSRR